MKNKLESKYQVFVSSTRKDLKAERDCAIKAIALNGNIPVAMEGFRGSDYTWPTIMQYIKKSDIYLLIIGDSYGSVVDETGKSYTEMEYDYAVSLSKPVIVIEISDKMTAVKEKNDPFVEYHEKEHITELEVFKKRIRKRINHSVNSLPELEKEISSEINDKINNYPLKMSGWISLKDAVNARWVEKATTQNMKKSISILVEELVKRHYKGVSISGYHESISSMMMAAITCDDLLENEIRSIQFSYIQEGKMKVTLSRILKYYRKKNMKYSFGFHATEEQAYSYKIESLIIDSEDRTAEAQKEIIKDNYRIQLPFFVKSTNTFNVKKSCEIRIRSSFTCSPETYFHTHSLDCPCGRLSVTIQLDEKLSQDYQIVSYVSSPYTEDPSDNVKANNILNTNAHSIVLPKWSPRGSGYAVTLIKKAKDEHE